MTKALRDCILYEVRQKRIRKQYPQYFKIKGVSQ